jgi:hypothetical protein
MTSKKSYSDHLEVLTALVTYLALTDSKSRTAEPLAANLFLPRDEVQEVLDAFPGIFRRGVDRKNGKIYYTVHARYALRRYPGGDEGAGLPTLRADILKVLLDLITGNARAEQAQRHQNAQLDAARRHTYIAAGVATAAALLTLAGAILVGFFGGK